MKSLYLTISSLVLAIGSFGQYGQIANGGFENWSNTTIYEYPTLWGNSNSDEYQGIPTVVKSSDAQAGTYSAELRTELILPSSDTLMAYIYHGDVSTGGPSGGIPYTSNFDEVKFWYKSNVSAGDTLFLIYIRFAVGVPVDMGLIPISTPSTTVWTQASVSVPSGVQDELFIGFTLGDPMNGTPANPGAWVRIDNVEMYNSNTATTPLPDQGFEQWSTQSVETPDNWWTLNEYLAGSGMENANKTTDANAGTYALELSTALNPLYGDTIRGFLSMGPFLFNGPNPFLPVPYSANPTTFSGAYKYAPSGIDGGNIQIVFMQGGTPIGSHMETFTSAASYTTFTSPLTITGTPDSVIFVAFSGNNPGSVLKLDNLQFSGGNVGIDEFAQMRTNIYPNPANDAIYVKAEGAYELTIVDLSGKEVYSSKKKNIGPQQIDITQFEQGNYLVILVHQSGTEMHKLCVQ